MIAKCMAVAHNIYKPTILYASRITGCCDLNTTGIYSHVSYIFCTKYLPKCIWCYFGDSKEVTDFEGCQTLMWSFCKQKYVPKTCTIF